jgi:DNA-binding PadR family transcriptional regulator
MLSLSRSIYRTEISARDIVLIHINPTHRGDAVGRNRTGVLEFAVLGLLYRTPMHGYELSKQLNVLLGTFRALSYGTLYPCLNKLYADGLIAKEDDQPAAAARQSARPGTRPGARQGPAARPGRAGRSKIVYRLTAEGKERLQDLLADSGPAAWEDDEFGVHFAFFGQTSADIRLRILEGRRSRLEDRMEGVRAALARTRERVDSYTLELQRHGLESVEREVRWLNELIASERRSEATSGAAGGPYPPTAQTDIDRVSEKESS